MTITETTASHNVRTLVSAIRARRQELADTGFRSDRDNADPSDYCALRPPRADRHPDAGRHLHLVRTAPRPGRTGRLRTEPLAAAHAAGQEVPQGVAQLIAFLASDAAAYITGSEYLVDGGWHLNR